MNRLLIVGFAYSGSTLLSLGLSRSPSLCALGEVPLAPVRGSELPCTCGRPFAECSVWGTYFAERSARRFDLAEIFRCIETNVARTEPNVEWIIDSGKTQHGGLSAHIANRDASLRIVHLVRHPAAVAYSCLWRGMDLDEAVDLWIAMEEHAQRDLSRVDVPTRTVCFEEMVEHFGTTLATIGQWLGVAGPNGETTDPWRYDGCSWTDRAHMMGSNTSVKFEGRTPEVVVDDRFRRALPASVITSIERRTLHLWPPKAARE